MAQKKKAGSKSKELRRGKKLEAQKQLTTMPYLPIGIQAPIITKP